MRGGQYYYRPERDADPLEQLATAQLEHVPLDVLAAVTVASLTYPEDVKLDRGASGLKQALAERSTREPVSDRVRELMNRAGIVSPR